MAKSLTKTRIIFGATPPKDWQVYSEQVYSELQKNSDFRETYLAWDKEANPKAKELYRLKLEEYEANVRKELNLPEE